MCVCVGVWVCVLLSLCVGMREGQKQRKRRQKEETHEAGNAGPVDQRMTVTSARDCLLPDADGDAVGDVAIRVKRLHTRQLLGLLWRGTEKRKTVGLCASQHEQRENFLLQNQLSALTLISVSVPPPCYRSSTYKIKVILPEMQVAGYS